MCDKINLFQFDCFWLFWVLDGVECWINPKEQLSNAKFAQNNAQLYLRVRWYKVCLSDSFPGHRITILLLLSSPFCHSFTETYFKLVDTTALNLFYLQISQMIVSGSYPVSEKVHILDATFDLERGVKSDRLPQDSLELLCSWITATLFERNTNLDFLRMH